MRRFQFRFQIGDFSSVWDPLACWLSNSVLKQCFLDIDLTTSFAVRNFKNAWDIRVILSFKIFKISCRFQKGSKNSEINFCLLYHCIWSDCGNFSLVQREYLWSAVNMLRNSPKISDVTKRVMFQLYLPQNDKKTW